MDSDGGGQQAAVRFEYLHLEDEALCAIVDLGMGSPVAAVNTRWGREYGEAHVMTHLGLGVAGALTCSIHCREARVTPSR